MNARRIFILRRPWKLRDAAGGVSVVVLALLLLVWTGNHVGLSVTELARGVPWMGDFISRLFPPNWQFLQRLAKPVAETIEISLWGTIIAAILALPLSFLGARNFSPNRAVYYGTRQIFNVARGINELIFALLFVAAVGLGTFPGVLALAVHGAGMLGKFFSEAIEEMDRGPIEALRATGASTAQTIAFAVLPQVLPAWIAAVLYRFETNLRASTILGMVGAGGIGFELYSSMRLFQYQDTATCILVILALVMSADYLSSRLRAVVLGA